MKYSDSNDNAILFSTRSIWLNIGIDLEQRSQRIEFLYGKKRSISNREEAIACLRNVIDKLSLALMDRIQLHNTYKELLDLFGILNEVMAYYLEEKKDREEMVKNGFRDKTFLDLVNANRNIERNIIDACNIWIENCILYQSQLQMPGEGEYSINKELLLDLYLYGFASQGLSLLNLSKELKDNTFYGLSIDPKDEMPLNILKDHPTIFYNPAVGGNQAVLGNIDGKNFDNMTVSKGFVKEYGVALGAFIGRLEYIRKTLLEDNCYAQIVMLKEDFILQMNDLIPPINGRSFYDCVTLNKKRVTEQLKEGEKTIWRIGSNQYRLEIRPIVELDDGNVLINYAACTQSMELWFSYCLNGGSCYVQTRKKDHLLKAMEIRNKELADTLLNKIREILRDNYDVYFDSPNVNYKRIFGQQEIDYGDYDVVFYSYSTKELFLIESKFLSDSLNAGSMVNDYKKIFSSGGYYDHCRARCDLVINNPEKMKKFIKVSEKEKIRTFFIFLTSKPIETDLQDKDGIVLFLSLNVLDGFIKGKFVKGNKTIRPEMIL